MMHVQNDPASSTGKSKMAKKSAVASETTTPAPVAAAPAAETKAPRKSSKKTTEAAAAATTPAPVVEAAPVVAADSAVEGSAPAAVFDIKAAPSLAAIDAQITAVRGVLDALKTLRRQVVDDLKAAKKKRSKQRDPNAPKKAVNANNGILRPRVLPAALAELAGAPEKSLSDLNSIVSRYIKEHNLKADGNVTLDATLGKALFQKAGTSVPQKGINKMISQAVQKA